jgi:hypothetical protein
MSTFILHTVSLEDAIEEIRNSAGQVTQICTHSIIIAILPDDFEVSKLKFSNISIPEDIDKVSKLFVDAWGFDSQKEVSKIINWGEEGHQYPKNRFNDKELAEQFEVSPPSTSSYMIGGITIGLVIVQGKDSSLIFSQNEIDNTISQTMSGLQSLAAFEPMADITFKYQISILSIDAPRPITDCPSFETCESIWRDPALKLLGCSTGLDGVNEYNRRLIQETGNKWAFTAFFTKYPLFHFAYAASGRICMNYCNDGWGPSQINKVLAHETCHIFGAADEYSESQCTCDNSGYFNVPNYNCDNCTSSFPKVSCLMKKNDLSTLCEWSRWQLGWAYSIIAKELAHGDWNNYYGTAVVFESGDKSYLFAHSDSGDRWFISELTPDGEGLKTELAHGNWNNYYGTAVVFESGDKSYLFAQSDSGDRWFISELTPDGEGLKTELAHGNWNNYYGTAVVFESGDKSYLFAQSDSGDRWFISELTPDGEGLKTELAHGNWNNYYGTAVVFVMGNKNHLFAQSDSGDRWFISELTPNGEGLKIELAHGNWNNYYGTAVVFESGGKSYFFAQTHPTFSANRWFIS